MRRKAFWLLALAAVLSLTVAGIAARATEVRFELEEDAGGTIVRLSHRGFPEPAQRESHSHGWSHYALRLKTVAEGGDPGPDLMGEA